MPLASAHVGDGKVYFGINHEMVDFVHDRKKDLDLVLCTSSVESARPSTFADLASHYGIVLTSEQRENLSALPVMRRGEVSSVLLALEAKACMTAHQKALPRLYDELNSSHATVHGATDEAIAAGFVMINHATRYLSPDLNKRDRSIETVWSTHPQPRFARIAVDKVLRLPRRSKTGDVGYDALAIVVVDCANDGSPVSLLSEPPAPDPGSIGAYATMIDRLAHIYTTRFKDL